MEVLMMIIDSEFRKKLKELETKLININGELPPAGVVLLNNLLVQTKSPIDRADIYEASIMEYKKAKMFDKELSTLRIYSTEFVTKYNDFHLMVSLANRLSYDQGYAVEAKEIINNTLAKAKKKNEFVRLVLGVKARIARRVEDKELFSEAILELISDYENNWRELEVQFEEDL